MSMKLPLSRPIPLALRIHVILSRMIDPGAPENQSSIDSPARQGPTAQADGGADAVPLSAVARILLIFLYLLP